MKDTKVFSSNLLYIVLALVLCRSGSLHATDQSAVTDRENLLALYRPNYERVRNHYSNLEIVEIASGEAIRNRFKLDQVEFMYRAVPGSCRIDTIIGNEIQSSTINTRDFRFVADAQPDKHGAFVLVDANSASYDVYQKRIQNGAAKLPFDPYCWLDQTLLEYLSGSTTTINNVTHEGPLGNRRCIVETQYPARNGKQVPLRLEFLEDKSWVLAKGIWTSGYTCEIEYDEDNAVVPMIRKATVWVPGDSTPEKPRRMSVRKSSGPPPISLDIFSPTAFGLPRFANEFHARPWWIWLLIAIVTIIFLIFAFIKARAALRRQTGQGAKAPLT